MARARARAASSSRLFGGALVSRAERSRAEIPEISSMAARNGVSLAFDGFVKPLIFRTNCSDAARISSSVVGGSKLKSGLIFLHIRHYFSLHRRAVSRARPGLRASSYRP